jgi:hypothetical protein
VLNQKSQEIVSGHIGGVCPVAADDDSKGIIIDVLLISHQRQKCQRIGLKRVRHGPSARGDARSHLQIGHGASFYTVSSYATTQHTRIGEGRVAFPAMPILTRVSYWPYVTSSQLERIPRPVQSSMRSTFSAQISDPFRDWTRLGHLIFISTTNNWTSASNTTLGL